MTTRGLGYRPDPHDPTRPRYGLPSSALVLPDKLDLTEHAPGVEDQGGESCVGFGLAEVAYGKQSIEGFTPVYPSPGFIWWNSRKRHGDEALNVGTYPSVAVQTLNDLGLCPEEDWPIKGMAWKFAERPPHIAYTHAYDARFDVQSLLLDADERQVKSAMATHGPLAFGMPVHEGYLDLGAAAWASTRAGTTRPCSATTPRASTCRVRGAGTGATPAGRRSRGTTSWKSRRTWRASSSCRRWEIESWDDY